MYVTLSDTPVERVASFKLLGVYVASDLKWKQHIDTITSKAAPRLYLLKQLKRWGASQRDLLCFYTTIIRPVLEYACPAWQSSLMAAQSRALESIQNRAMRIIYADDDDYTLLLILAALTRWSRGAHSWLNASLSAACCPSHPACTICCQTDVTCQWQADSATPEHSNLW